MQLLTRVAVTVFRIEGLFTGDLVLDFAAVAWVPLVRCVRIGEGESVIRTRAMIECFEVWIVVVYLVGSAELPLIELALGAFSYVMVVSAGVVCGAALGSRVS